MSKIILVGVDVSQPAKRALENAANLASKNESHLYIVHVTEEFGELIQRRKRHDGYVGEVKRLSKDCFMNESSARELDTNYMINGRRIAANPYLCDSM